MIVTAAATKETPTQRRNRFSFAVPVWVVRVWRLDRNLQTKKDDKAAENVSSRLQAIRHQSERVTHKSGRNLCNRQAKIYQYSEKRGSHAPFCDPFRDSIRTRHVLILTIFQGCDLYLKAERRHCNRSLRPVSSVGVRPEVTRDNMGHSTVDVTQNVYNKTWWEERVEAVSMAAATVWREFMPTPQAPGPM
jgi:hypothetical protein